jgi:glycosyltransferase involved in cell wall biosynthesis
MRLLLATPYFAPAYAFGGSVTVAETMVEDFLAAGHEVTVVTTDVLDETSRIAVDAPAQPAGAEVVRFPNVSHRLAAGANGYLPRGLRRWMRPNAGRFDAGLLHDVYSLVSVGAARGLARAGVPYALQPLGTLSPAAERGRPVAKRAFLAAFGNRTVADASMLIHSSDDERGDFLAVGAPADRLVRLPLPLDLPAASGAARADRPTVAYVGRLHAIKRIDRLVDAIAIVRDRVPDVRLEVVGPGERVQAELEAQVARLGLGDHVLFHGFVSVAEKLDILARAHVSALLSASEGLPMAALEAMACGTAVVLSSGCHLPEAHDRAGLVVPGGAADAAEAIATLLLDAPLRDRLSTGAAEFAREFRREEVMPRMIGAFEALARSGRADEAAAAAL